MKLRQVGTLQLFVFIFFEPCLFTSHNFGRDSYCRDVDDRLDRGIELLQLDRVFDIMFFSAAHLQHIRLEHFE